MTDLDQRLPPHDLNAEEAVLGSIIIDGDSIAKVSFLRPEDFYREKHNWLFAAMLKLQNDQAPIDQVTLAHALGDKLEPVGGPAYLAHLVSIVPTSVHVVYYGRLIHRCSVYRQMIVAAESIKQKAYASDDTTLATAEEALYEIRLRQAEAHKTSWTAKELADDGLTYYDQVRAGERKPPVSWGLVDLDRKTAGGIYPGELALIGARPSVGKTELLKGFALDMAQEHSVAFFSAEQGVVPIRDRIIATLAQVPLSLVRQGLYDDAVAGRIRNALAELSQLSLVIDDKPYMTTAHIEARCQALKGQRNLDVVLVDYVQLLTDQPGIARTSEARVAYISRRLKGIARNFDVALIAASQLNRLSTYGTPRPPRISEFRDSGALEQDADIALLMNRPEAEYTDNEWQDVSEGEPYPKGQTTIFLAKLRQGGTDTRGKLSIIWHPKKQRYVSAAKTG